MSNGPTQDGDVIVIGGGLAGKAASIHLAKAGFKVVCIEPESPGRQSVGESLDWSAPALLNALGLPMEYLVQSQIATWKRHVTLRLADGSSAQYIPSPWLGKKPFHIELRTLHVDRVRLDQELLSITREHGVTLVKDKVVKVERDADRIRSVITAAGARFSSSWFIDASGFGASIFAREFNIPEIRYGPAKVALWTYFSVSDSPEGTTLYVDPNPSEYLSWIWEIPINPTTVSVGYITTGEAIKSSRGQGLSVEEVFANQLMKFPHLEELLRTGARTAIYVTSFRCRAHTRNAGPNWVIAGEAAAMVDPITANGVTSALRHAAEATSMIQRYGKAGTLPWYAQTSYNRRVLSLAKFFNGGIEMIIYEQPVRNRIGLSTAGTVYTGPAWSMNAVYARLKPNGFVPTALFAAGLACWRASGWIFYQFCR